LRYRRICCILSTRKQQILRSSTPATAKAAIAGDPGFAQDDTSKESYSAAYKAMPLQRIFLKQALSKIEKTVQ
jgi:hypothetical protein